MLICYLKISIWQCDWHKRNVWNQCEMTWMRKSDEAGERGRERSDEQANKVRTSERKTSKTKISDDKQKNNNLWTNHSVHVAVWRHIEPLNYSAALLRLSFLGFCLYRLPLFGMHVFMNLYNKRCAGRVRVAHTLIEIRYMYTLE